MVGTGLIGASIALGLRSHGWHVTGSDIDSSVSEEALAIGALDAIGCDPEAEVTFVATPAGAVVDEASRVLSRGDLRSDALVTDVAGVKSEISAAISDPRFVGGHPMAGSEQLGVQGADPGIFVGATWVLTPVAATNPDDYARLRSVVGLLGAEVVALSPEQHDELVAVVSHVPHLTAAVLMNLADQLASEHAALLRLAAGGFRDMTRIAAGDSRIWPDICAANAAAIVGTLDELLVSLAEVRDTVKAADRGRLLDLLDRAGRARRSLPVGAAAPARLAEIRVPVQDRPGVVAEITTLAGDQGINILDLEIAHSSEGDQGVLVLVVDAEGADRLKDALGARSYRAVARLLDSP